MKLSSNFGQDVILTGLFQEVNTSLLVCSFPWRTAIFTLCSVLLSNRPVTALCLRPSLGRLGQISCHFLHSARALIENLGGLAYLFFWNSVGCIFMAFSQQCSVSNSNYNNKKKRKPVPVSTLYPGLNLQYNLGKSN